MKSVINEQELKKGIEKISVYKTEEDLYFDDIKTSLNKLNNLYKTTNKESLANINLELNQKFKKISNIHENYISIFNKTITKYKDTNKEVNEILSDIDTDIYINLRWYNDRRRIIFNWAKKSKI